jgi:plasmid maintenance system antidote protein VapI
MAKRRTKTLADMLREKIRECGLSANTLAGLTGIKQQTISEFLRGKDIRLATAQKLFDYFGITINS